MNIEVCPGCGCIAQLKFHKWANNPNPASGISEPGVYVCDTCATKGEDYEDRD